jgi:hypothetical protein
MIEPEEMDNRFDHHPPTGSKVQQHANVRYEFKQLAIDMDNWLPEGREKALVFTNLEQAMFWANAAIARRS